MEALTLVNLSLEKVSWKRFKLKFKKKKSNSSKNYAFFETVLTMGPFHRNCIYLHEILQTIS
jgi:hypothetical protein